MNDPPSRCRNRFRWPPRESTDCEEITGRWTATGTRRNRRCWLICEAQSRRGAAAYGAIEEWSVEELRSLHDDLHERDGGIASGVGAASARSMAPAKPAYMIPKALR